MLVISNGFKNFHLVMAAAEAYKRNILSMYIAGAYPTKAIVRVLSVPLIRGLINYPRFMARAESIDDELIRSKWMPEVLNMFSLKLAQLALLKPFSDYLQIVSFKWYSKQAIRDVINAHEMGAKIYHYRAGFGNQSVKIAKELGMVTLCDHSIVHPATLQYMIDHDGKMPGPDDATKINYFWRSVLDDFEYADAILVNSEFVKTTFVSQGYDTDRIHVAYQGIDESFLEYVSSLGPVDKSDDNVLRMMFAGNFGERKGADVLIESLLNIENIDWSLDIAGSVSPYVKQKYGHFLNDSRVNALGMLSRVDLARHMKSSDIFVFPSLAEGSARVVFEALACGCYVITTPNSGSIIENGVHGELVAPGSAMELKNAIVKAASDLKNVRDVGANNVKIVNESYLQSIYGEKLKNIYGELVFKLGG